MTERVTILAGDMLERLDDLEPNSVDAVVTDPPYHLTSIVKRYGKPGAKRPKGKGAAQRLAKGFMGKQWDGGDVAFQAETWAKVLRVMKPGAFLCAFSATRTYHRMVTAIEDAGFVICDQLDWLYGSGFPKSVNVARAIDKHHGVEGGYGAPKSPAHAGWIERGRMRGEDGEDGWQRPWMDDEAAVERAAREYVPASEDARAWDGWGTALKPAHEPIVLAQKPMSERTIAANVLRWGTGALFIAACRVPVESQCGDMITDTIARERWPANVLHDGSEEVEREFAAFGEGASRPNGKPAAPYAANGKNAVYGAGMGGGYHPGFADVGSPSRFFYCAKASDEDRLGSAHPTVKPIALMGWLVRLVTPVGGLVLDPFAGTGTTAMAAMQYGRRAVVIEREAEYLADIARRVAHVAGQDTPLFGGDAEVPAGGGGRRVYGRFAKDKPPNHGRKIGPIGLKR